MPVASEKEMRRSERQLIDRLEELGGKRNVTEDDVVFQGDKIILPATMTWKRMQDFCAAKITEENETASYHRDYLYRPWDGAYCTQNVLKRVFGSITLKGKPGWFGVEPPHMIQINSGVGETTTVPWGNMVLPLFPSVQFELDAYHDPERGVLFRITADGPKRLEHRIKGIFKLIEDELATASLYRGKAFDGQDSPDFIDVFSVDPDKVVYSEHVRKQLGASVWAHLQHTDVVKKAGLSLKRAVLLYGPFGVGKTLGCMLTGQQAVTNAWTFIAARPGRDNIATVLQTARLYQPCVVFYEDVDAVIDEESSRSAVSKLLDDFDGINAKGTQIMVVMTTNYPEKIQAGMVRPGRIDHMILIDDLDEAGVRKLVETVIPLEQLRADIDWAAVYEAAEGYKPAFVTEMAGRTTLYMISDYGDEYDQYPVGTDQLVAAANGLRDQYMKMLGAAGMPSTDPLSAAVKKSMDEALVERLHPKILVDSNGS